MKISEVTENPYKAARDAKFKGTRVATHLVGKTGRPIPDDIQKLASKHIRQRTNTTVKPQYPYYINQYDDVWYQNVFGVSGWDKFWEKFKPYYAIGYSKSLTEAPIRNVRDGDDEPWGLVPDQLDIARRGLRVMMRPSKFLQLAYPLSDVDRNPKVKQHIELGGDISSPYLDIKLPKYWFDDPPDFLYRGTVVGHDGRNRMEAWQEKHGDDPVEVHLFFRDGIRREDLTDEMIRYLQRGLHNEATRINRTLGEYILSPFVKVL